MYKPETITRYVSKATAALFPFMAAPVQDLQPHISAGNAKIHRAVNYSTLPVICCGNCAKCSRVCYALKIANRLPNVMHNWAENTAIIRRDPERLFSAMDKAMDGADEARYHVGGEVETLDQADLMNRTAARHPSTVTWTYTHMHGLMNEYLNRAELAPNYSVMYSADSAEDAATIPNPHGMPMFIRVDSLDEVPDGAWTCPGNCDVCHALRRGCPYRETTYCRTHR